MGSLLGVSNCKLLVNKTIDKRLIFHIRQQTLSDYLLAQHRTCNNLLKHDTSFYE